MLSNLRISGRFFCRHVLCVEKLTCKNHFSVARAAAACSLQVRWLISLLILVLCHCSGAGEQAPPVWQNRGRAAWQAATNCAATAADSKSRPRRSPAINLKSKLHSELSISQGAASCKPVRMPQASVYQNIAKLSGVGGSSPADWKRPYCIQLVRVIGDDRTHALPVSHSPVAHCAIGTVQKRAATETNGRRRIRPPHR